MIQSGYIKHDNVVAYHYVDSIAAEGDHKIVSATITFNEHGTHSGDDTMFNTRVSQITKLLKERFSRKVQ